MQQREVRWAVEISSSTLDHRNLADLVCELGFDLVDSEDNVIVTCSAFETFASASEVWEHMKPVRAAFTGSAQIDATFTLASVVEFGAGGPKKYRFLEPDPISVSIVLGSPTLRISLPADLSPDEQRVWEENQAESQYQQRLEKQCSRLVPAFKSKTAAKVLELLAEPVQTGATLYKAYELMEGHPSNRQAFHAQFGVASSEFDRFKDVVHNPAVSGDFARHGYAAPPRTAKPMTTQEAEQFVSSILAAWLAAIRTGP